MNSSIDFAKLHKNEKSRYLQLKSISAKLQSGGSLNENDYKIMYRQEKQRYLELKEIHKQDPTFIAKYLGNQMGGFVDPDKQKYKEEKQNYLKLKNILSKKQSGGQLTEDDYKILYKLEKRKYIESNNHLQ
jgi:hypothetical protein